MNKKFKEGHAYQSTKVRHINLKCSENTHFSTKLMACCISMKFKVVAVGKTEKYHYRTYHRRHLGTVVKGYARLVRRVCVKKL